MVVYILGNSIAKRQTFEQSDGETVYVDNEEVLSSTKTEDGWWYAVGDNPFADMTVESYVAYQRAFIDRDCMSRKHVKSLLRKVKFKKRSTIKMGKLNVFDLRKVQIASKIKSDTKHIVINLDGTIFCKKTQRALLKLICDLKSFSLSICISDTRFVKQPCILSQTQEDGTNHYVPLFYTSKKKPTSKLTKPIKSTIDQSGKIRIKKAVKCSGLTNK